MKAQKELEPILRLLGQWLLKKYDEHFAKQGVGERGAEGIWKPRLPGQYYKGKPLPPRPVLIRSGKMKSGLRFKLSGSNLIFSSKKNYWVYHQFGTGRMHRPIFTLPPAYKRVIADSIAYFRATGIAKIIESQNA